jgi:hypothetical protein
MDIDIPESLLDNLNEDKTSNCEQDVEDLIAEYTKLLAILETKIQEIKN